jgi:hypothetical protein
MTTKREELLSRMIRIYGFENPATIAFTQLAETEINDYDLETIVIAHEWNFKREEEDD